ncbi:MAG TPA: DUF2059 domain-containing protein [Pyrinomonadaceae bacterium]|nr:DUF2059 domain-containing protein [Pyrinomonadaceae bacterium]
MSARKLAALMFYVVVIFGGTALGQSGGVAAGGRRAPVTLGAERRADILRLLDAMRVVEEEVKLLEPAFNNFKLSFPHVPAKVWEELRKEFDAEFNAEMIRDTYVPIFARHFSAAEVKALIKFYESPAGRKLLETMPRVKEEGYIVGYERGQSLGRRMQERLKARGYDPPET